MGNVVRSMREKDWRRQRFCSISCAKKVENAMHFPRTRERISRTLKAIGHAPRKRGGNGQLTVPQIQLLEKLGAEWQAELTVPTGPLRPPGTPKNFKIDIAHREKKIAIELDGQSHRTTGIRKADRQKVAFLLRNGWCVLRLSNAKALWLCSTCKSRDTLLTMLAEYLRTTVI